MSNFLNALTPQHPEDVERLAEVSILKSLRLSNIEIEKVWSDFSGSLCAGWLTVNEDTLKQFAEWVES